MRNQNTGAQEVVAPPAGWERRLLEGVSAAMLYVRSGRVEWANTAAHQLLGAPPGALVGYDALALVQPAEREQVRSRYAARLRGAAAPEHYEFGGLRFNGEPFRVEVEPRIFGEDELVLVLRDLGQQAADHALLSALSEVGNVVQHQHAQSDAVRAAVGGLHGLGFQVVAFRFEGEWAVVDAFGAGAELEQIVSAYFGVALADLRLPLAVLPSVGEAVRGGRVLTFADVPALVQSVLVALGTAPPADFVARLRGAKLFNVVLAPLRVRSAPWGFLAVVAERLRSNDAAAIALFATHFASAMEVVASIEQLEKQNAKLETLHALAMLGAAEPLELVVPTLLRTISEATGSDAACMYLLESESKELVLQGTWEYEGPLATRYRRIPLSGTANGAIAASMRPHALSISEWPERSRPDMVAAGFVEAAIVPLVVNGRLAGTITLTRRHSRRYCEDDLRSAEMLGAQIALQVERSRLYAEAQSRVEDLSLINEVGALVNQHLDLDQVLSTAMRHLSRIVEVPNTFLLLLSADGREVKMAATNHGDKATQQLTIPIDAPTSATEAIRLRHPVAIDDVSKDSRSSPTIASWLTHKALLAVPLISEGRAIGAMVLGETRAPRRFKPTEIERAVAVANQLASAIENARLYQEQRQRVEQLKVLLDISRLITGSLELQQILEATAQSLVRMVDATDSFIWFLDDNVLRGVVASAPEFKEHFSKVRLPLSETSAVGTAILTRAPARFEDALSSTEVNQGLNSRYRQKSLLAIPLMLREVPVGAIAVGDRRHRRAFSDDEVERALLIGRQLAVAIDNARLFDDLKRSYHELARAQQVLVQRERLAALGELSAVVAHEVRNPLGVIFNSLSSLKRMMPENEDARMLLGIVGEEADRLNRMVSDLLDFAKPSEAQLRPEPLDRVVQGAIEAAARAMPAPHVQVRTELSPTMPAVPIDAQMVRQAVVNLVVNAVQAMPRGGTVVVRSKLEKKSDGSFLRLEVEDDGPGIPPDLKEQVFQPFFTTKAAGTGLGLAVVKRIAEAHRAELSVENHPGRGAMFTLMIPVAP